MMQSSLAYYSGGASLPDVNSDKQVPVSQESLELKELFFSIITHDVKGPLGMLFEALNYLSENHRDLTAEELSEMLEGAKRSASGCYDLLNNLLSWKMSQSNQLEYKLERLRIDEVFQEQQELFSYQARQRKVSLIFEQNGVEYVVYDKEILALILRNLISNALKFTPAGGEIRVAVILNEGFVEFCVKDNGQGITPEDQNKLCRGMAAGEDGIKSTKRTGLGLKMCRDFVEKLGGIFWFESQWGKGSRFFFLIPQ